MQDHQYQLVLQFPISSQSSLDELFSIEAAVAEMLVTGPDDLDGHDVGSGAMNIFIDTHDPVAAFDRLKALIPANLLVSAKAAYRDFDSEEYIVIWPLHQPPFNLI
jgi:hypothetical protein